MWTAKSAPWIPALVPQQAIATVRAPGITANDVGVAGRAAFNDVRAPLIYQSATGYRYLVVRVP